MSTIECKNVYFKYTDEQDWIIQDLSITIKQGEWVSILGTNGSGKSTLARLINALLTPTSGAVTVAGKSTDDEGEIWNIRQKAGMVFQNPDHQFVAATVRDDIAFGLENAGVDRDEMLKRIASASERVGVDELLSAEPHRLSGGQKQRAAIAGVLALQPDIMIFDEATAMLDPKGRKEVMATMKQLHERGITILMITHELEEALESDRVVFMEHGKIINDSKAEEFFQKPEFLVERDFHLPYFLQVQKHLVENGFQTNYLLDEDEWVKSLCTSNSRM
ncbi:energy-coupling factor transporter ATPase [Geomicrobium sp. JCM 19038]|uniref:energy-coupling factor transporter ATPase n=1 Tax=Geomicrobium sp. JCM 19038 TaxID=1460635 RepID=UPI00045F1C79|nr:energy-coupling factor transporter ATPase [Geomicrobium sp. JCM 19038]GAK09583.1 ATPase component of general energizing module of ECF transporters [Geomicrobium sp. JCM 19038]